MNVAFKDEFGEAPPSLPLKNSGNIVRDNATRIEWNDVCLADMLDEVYVLGNPPFKGKKEQSDQQKNDIEHVFSLYSDYKLLDYVSCWFFKASLYLNLQKIAIRYCFVSTNSITQGEQVSILWDKIYQMNLSIEFAYKSFMWRNNAKDNAGVAVVIICVSRNDRIKKKVIYLQDKSDCISRNVNHINPYLSSGSDLYVRKRKSLLSTQLPKMVNGSMANDDGNFFIDKEEYLRLDKEVKKYFKKCMGSEEFYYGKIRYCLWLDDSNFDDAIHFEYIQNIVEKVRQYRLSSKRAATVKLAEKSYSFGEIRFKPSNAIIVPGLSAEKRRYIPIGYVNQDTVVTNLAQVIYEAEPWVFSLISSKMKYLWVSVTSGYFKKDLRFSPILSYNNFPLFNVSIEIKNKLTESALNILKVREQHSYKTIEQLYNPDLMPADLKQAHEENDRLVERCYRDKPFTSDEERLEHLFNLYEKMIAEEAANV